MPRRPKPRKIKTDADVELATDTRRELLSAGWQPWPFGEVDTAEEERTAKRSTLHYYFTTISADTGADAGLVIPELWYKPKPPRPQKAPKTSPVAPPPATEQQKHIDIEPAPTFTPAGAPAAPPPGPHHFPALLIEPTIPWMRRSQPTRRPGQLITETTASAIDSAADAYERYPFAPPQPAPRNLTPGAKPLDIYKNMHPHSPYQPRGKLTAAGAHNRESLASILAALGFTRSRQTNNGPVAQPARFHRDVRRWEATYLGPGLQPIQQADLYELWLRTGIPAAAVTIDPTRAAPPATPSTPPAAPSPSAPPSSTPSSPPLTPRSPLVT